MMRRLKIQRKILLVVSCILFVALLSACSLIRRDDEEAQENPLTVTTYGNSTQLEGSARLVCSPECSNRGFCGAATTGEQVVLMNTQNPSTQGYDLFMLDQSSVTIEDRRSLSVIYELSQGTENVIYYLVANEANQRGWVAGWCVGQ